MEKSPTKEKRRILKREIPVKFRLPVLVGLCILSGLYLSAFNILVTTQSIRKVFAWLFSAPLPMLGTALFLALLVLFLALVTRSLFAGGLTVSILVLLAVFINYFKNLLTATPLKLADIVLITKMGQIMELNSTSIQFSRNSIIAIVSMVLWLVVLLVMSRPLRIKWKIGLAVSAAPVALFILLFCVRAVADAWLYAPQKVAITTNYGQAYVNAKTGVVLGLWRSAIRPEDSGIDFTENGEYLPAAQTYIDEIEPGGDAGKSPNVIMLLSESFFDVTELPGITYEEDPLSDFHAAQAAGVSGDFHTRTLGYGTCSIEMEILTGINTRFFSADQLLSEWDPQDLEKLSTVPRLFQENGYYTAFLHTFNDSIYNRTPTYSRLGFDDLYFSGDFAAVDPDAAAAPDYWAYMQNQLSGGLYSDDYLADAIIKLYEREEDSPVFLYGVTMENHTPYPADKYESYDYPFTSGLPEDAVGMLNAVTQGAANSSKALGKLIEYFSDCGEPTIIVFFGDHRPGLPLDSGGMIYSELGMCPENSSEWSLENIEELYSTNYVIWANDESLLPALAGTDDADTSSNFLGLDVLRAADVELDAYWRMIASLKESCTAFTWEYFISADGELGYVPEDYLEGRDLEKFEVMTYLMRQAFSGKKVEPVFYQLK